MTYRKKLTIFLLAIATLFTFVLLIHTYQKNDSSLLSDKLLRFRVLADSDSSIDQYEKNELSKKMITPSFSCTFNCTDKRRGTHTFA